jgi:phosphate uptake regulator
MTAREFFEKVAEMRRAQRDYFKTRDKDTLIRSKQLEKEVDDEIKRVTKILQSNVNEEHV